MQNRFFLSFMTALLFGLTTLFHAEACDCLESHDYDCFIAQSDNKIYVNPEKITIIDNHFYLKVENSMMPVSTFHSDSNGIYLCAKKESEQGWSCPICFTYNKPGQLICINARNHWKYETD